MKTLKDHTLLYDEQCPLCVGYTKAFVYTGMLNKNGRHPFQQVNKLQYSTIDTKRAVNEIALINAKTQKVYYGLNSLLRVLGSSFPWIERAGRIPPLYYFLNKLYAFISYNRKVIISNPINTQNARDCEPTFNYAYRILYIVFAILFGAILLTGYNDLLMELGYHSNFYFEIIVLFLQIPFQYLFLKSGKPKVFINYAGHLVTVSLIGSLLMVPVWLLNSVIALPIQTNLLYFLLVATFLWFHHKKRVENLKLSPILSISWAIYRILLVILIYLL